MSNLNFCKEKCLHKLIKGYSMININARTNLHKNKTVLTIIHFYFDGNKSHNNNMLIKSIFVNT